MWSVAELLPLLNKDEPDPSMDVNGDGMTCLRIISHGTRATWHDNVIPN
jgi:hypothetical protein